MKSARDRDPLYITWKKQQGKINRNLINFTMRQQRIPKHFEEGEDTLDFLTKVAEGGRKKKCRGGKSCARLCVNYRALCHIRLDDKLSAALDRMKLFLAGRKAREAEITVAAKDAISAIKAQISQQLCDC